MQKDQRSYIRSSIFRRLFLPYVLIIALFVAAFCVWYLYSYRQNYRAMATEDGWQQANAFCTRVDRHLLTAQGLCNAMNSSESIRDLYQKAYVENKTVDSMQLYRVLSELTRIKASSGSLDVYTILLGIHGDNRLYTPGTVISLTTPLDPVPRTPWIGVASAAELLSLQGETNIMLNKRFLIYADAYSGLVGGSSKGLCLVLMELSALEDCVDAVRPYVEGLELRRFSETLYAWGTMDGPEEEGEIASLVGGGVAYRVKLSADALRVPFPMSALMPVVGMILLGAVFMLISYRYSRNRYRPIGVISRMVSREQGEGGDEMGGIVQGIADLIGERNGYRERMITISPYASQGALHQLLSGNVGDSQLEVLREEQFWELRRAWFAVGMVNLAVLQPGGAVEQRFLDARTLAAHAVQDFCDEDCTVACTPKDLQTLVVVANSDDKERLESVFYDLLKRINEALDDPAVSVTIGVSAPRAELERLRDACDEAERALENMLTGGRGSIYFEERDEEAAQRDYELPRDTRNRIASALREGNLEDLNAFMDGLWEANFRRKLLTPEAAHQLIDELHSALSGALRDVSAQSTTHIRAERVRQPATIEEIFDYYRSLLAEAVRTCQSEVVGDRSGEALETEIRDYINRNLMNPDMSLSRVADHFGVSGKLVGSVCRSAFGKNYLQYVRDCQIQEAARLLQTTDLPLEEIAERCGFTNLLTFRRNFKSVMNMNPSDFRR